MSDETVKMRRSAIVQSPDKQSWRLSLPDLKVAKSFVQRYFGRKKWGRGTKWLGPFIPVSELTDEAICRAAHGMEKIYWDVPRRLLVLAESRLLVFLAAHQHMVSLISSRKPFPVSVERRNQNSRRIPPHLNRAQHHYDSVWAGYIYMQRLIKKYHFDYERTYREPLHTTVLKAWRGDQVALCNLLTFDWDGWIQDPRGRQLCERLLTPTNRGFWKDLGMKLRRTGWKYPRVRGNASRQMIDKLIQTGLLPREPLKDIPTSFIFSKHFVSALEKTDRALGSKIVAKYQPITEESAWTNLAIGDQFADPQEFRRFLKSVGVIKAGSRKSTRRPKGATA